MLDDAVVTVEFQLVKAGAQPVPSAERGGTRGQDLNEGESFFCQEEDILARQEPEQRSDQGE